MLPFLRTTFVSLITSVISAVSTLLSFFTTFVIVSSLIYTPYFAPTVSLPAVDFTAYIPLSVKTSFVDNLSDTTASARTITSVYAPYSDEYGS